MSGKRFDILVIGAGPAGMSVAAECTYHETGSVCVLEKGATHNQTIHVYYPEDKRVDAAYLGQEATCYGILCFRDTSKPGYLEIVEKLLKEFPYPILYNHAVDSVKKDSNGEFIVFCNGEEYRSRFVVLSIGRMGKPNRPEYFNEIPAKVRSKVRFDLKNIDPTGKKILVVGGGNSAAEFAMWLAPKAKVTLSYRGASFDRLNPINLKLLGEDEKNQKLTILRNSNIAKVEDDNGLPKVVFKEGSSQTFDEIVYAIGGSSPTVFLQGAGLELDAKGNPKLTEDLESTVPGIFVGGELCVPPGKGSIILGFNSGKKIAEAIAKRLGKARKPEMTAIRALLEAPRFVEKPKTKAA